MNRMDIYIYIYIFKHTCWEASAALLTDEAMGSLGADVAQQPRLSLTQPPKDEGNGWERSWWWT